MPSLNSEGRATALGLLLGQSSSAAPLHPAPVTSVSGMCWRQSLPLPGLCPCLPQPGCTALGLGPGQSLPPWDSVTNEDVSPAVSLALAIERRWFVKSLAPLSPGYQSCREAVAAFYTCPEAPLEAQVPALSSLSTEA